MGKFLSVGRVSDERKSIGAHTRSREIAGGLCGPGRNGEDCATILNSLQTLPPFIPTNSKLKYSTLVTAETSLQFCAVLRSSAQFCAVLRSLQLADPDLAVLRSSNVQPRGHPVLTPSCSSGASQTPLTSCNTRTWPKLHSQLSTHSPLEHSTIFCTRVREYGIQSIASIRLEGASSAGAQYVVACRSLVELAATFAVHVP